MPRLLALARKKGLRRAFDLLKQALFIQVRAHSSKKRRYIFISNPLEFNGAPLVLLQMIHEFTINYGFKSVQLLAPGGVDEVLKQLQRDRVALGKAALGLGKWLIGLQTAMRKNDFVLMNTVAIYDNYYEFVIKRLESGRLKHAFWFIHEDKAQLKVVNASLQKKQEIHRLRPLIESGRLTILVPSARTKHEYDELFSVKKVRVMHLRVDVPAEYQNPKSPSDYQTINFLLQGLPSDGRKGQLLAIPAFYAFIKNHFEKSPQAYRDFKLHLVALRDDYVSQQIRWVGQSLLDKRVEFYPMLPREEALAVTAKCNAVICCSLNETFGLSVAEGMLMGHVVLRNNSAGVDEQLKDGVNGYFIDHTDINAFAGVIEKVLNKEITSDEELQKMGKASQKMVQNYQSFSYLEQIEKL